MTRYDEAKREDGRLMQQAQAEFDFSQVLEENGYATDQFRKQMGLSAHQFNVLAHYVYCVHDEEPDVTPQILALIAGVRAAQQHSDRIAMAVTHNGSGVGISTAVQDKNAHIDLMPAISPQQKTKSHPWMDILGKFEGEEWEEFREQLKKNREQDAQEAEGD